MPTRKQPPEPSLRTILKEIRSQGVILTSHDLALAELRAQGVRLEERVEGQGERIEEQIGSQGVRLEAQIRSQGIVLEEMRSQNRATIEAVEAARLALEQRIDRLEQETGARDLALELAIKDLQINVKENTLGMRDLTARVEALQRLEDRVAALERRGS